jgi:hypothetical protein
MFTYSDNTNYSHPMLLAFFNLIEIYNLFLCLKSVLIPMSVSRADDHSTLFRRNIRICIMKSSGWYIFVVFAGTRNHCEGSVERGWPDLYLTSVGNTALQMNFKFTDLWGTGSRKSYQWHWHIDSKVLNSSIESNIYNVPSWLTNTWYIYREFPYLQKTK